MRIRKKKLYLLIFALFTAVAVTAAGLVQNYKIIHMQSDSIERRIADDGTIYELISVGDNRLCLRTMTTDGIVTGYYPLPASAQRNMYTAYHTIGFLGRELYLYSYETAGNTPERRGEIIVAYNMTDGSSRIVAEVPSPDTFDKCDVFFAQNTSGDAVFLGFLDRESKSLTLERIDAANGDKTKLPVMSVPFPLSSISVAETGEMFALSRDSRVYMLDGNGWTCLFEPDRGEAVANMTVGLNDEVYLFAASPDGARALASTHTNRIFSPMNLDAGGLIKLHIAEPGRWIALDESYRHVMFFKGEMRVISALRVSFFALWSLDSLLIAATCAFIATGLFATVRKIWLRRRLHLLSKLLLIIIPLFTLGLFSLVLIAKGSVEEAVETGLRESILEYAYEAMEDIDAERFAEIDWSKPFEDKYFTELLTCLEKLSEYRIIETVKDKHNAYANYSVCRVEGGKVYTAVDGHNVAGLAMKYFEYSSKVEERDEMLRLRVPVSAILGRSDSNIRWLAVLFPILADDEVVGYLEVARPLTAIDEAVYSVTRVIILAGLLVFAAIVTALIFVLAISTKTLSKLKHGALAVSGGDYSARVETKSWDETGEIAAAFNKMALSVKAAIGNITEVSNGYRRFVPDKLIELLEKDAISALCPGDHKRLTATHILLYTNSFDTLRDKLFFDALGRFHNMAIPCIASGGGLISQYSPRGLGAVFENTPEATLRAVIAIFSVLDREWDGACYVFMSYSGVMLGVTGNGENLNMITVSRLSYKSHDVGVAGKRFGTRLIVSQSAYTEMGEAVKQYHHRFIGFLHDDEGTWRLYDFYDCDTAKIKVKKEGTKERFENGVELYYAKEYSKARRVFVNILKEFPDDAASREFLRRSHAGHVAGGEPLPLIDLR